MHFTEIVTPSIKQDQESQANFWKAIELLTDALDSSEGLKQRKIGRIISQNGTNVEKEFRIALGFEWKDISYFKSILETKAFQAFIGEIKEVVLTPPNPQVYGTNVEPNQILNSPLTEVFRVKVGDRDVQDIESRWKAVVDVSGIKMGTSYGTSLNLDEKVFMGAIAWNGHEERESTLDTLSGSREWASFNDLTVDSFLTQFK